MAVNHQRITDKLIELGITDRVTVSSSLELCIHLRAKGLNARFSQTREVTVPLAEEHDALRATQLWRKEPTDWIAEGRRLIGRAA